MLIISFFHSGAVTAVTGGGDWCGRTCIRYELFLRVAHNVTPTRTPRESFYHDIKSANIFVADRGHGPWPGQDLHNLFGRLVGMYQ
jgi:hypothetical protein